MEDMKLPSNQRKKTYGGAYEAYNPDASDDEKVAINADLEGINNSEGQDTDEDTKKKRKKKKSKRDQQKPSCEYNLYLQDDTYADGAMFQWYYFSVMNIR